MNMNVREHFIPLATVILVILVPLFNGCLGAATLAPSPEAPSNGAQKELPKAEWETRWEKLVSGAKQEGKVVFYGQIPNLFKDKVTKAFKEKYGIEVDALIGRPPEVAERYFRERLANLFLADVLITGTTTTLNTIKPKGILVSPKPHLVLPEVLDPKAWPEGVLPFSDRDELVLALVSSYSRFLAINTGQVKEGDINSYQDLLNPKWKGRITIYDPSLAGAGSAWFTFVLLKVLGREAGEKYMRQLATQDPVITRDSRLHGETVAKGKYAIGIGPAFEIVAELASAGAPIGWNRTKEGGIMIAGGLAAALPDRPDHPNGAALMLNYLLTKEGQLMISEAAGLPARRLDVPTTYALPGTTLQPGDTTIWEDEDFILLKPVFWPLAKEIFGSR